MVLSYHLLTHLALQRMLAGIKNKPLKRLQNMVHELQTPNGDRRGWHAIESRGDSLLMESLRLADTDCTAACPSLITV